MVPPYSLLRFSVKKSCWHIKVRQVLLPFFFVGGGGFPDIFNINQYGLSCFLKRPFPNLRPDLFFWPSKNGLLLRLPKNSFHIPAYFMSSFAYWIWVALKLWVWSFSILDCSPSTFQLCHCRPTFAEHNILPYALAVRRRFSGVASSAKWIPCIDSAAWGHQ